MTSIISFFHNMVTKAFNFVFGESASGHASTQNVTTNGGTVVIQPSNTTIAIQGTGTTEGYGGGDVASFRKPLPG